LKGEDFTKLVVNNSEEPRVKESKGKLSYFSVFTMVYSFENEAYNTPIGGISDIVRTQFGYHILKVTGRRERTPKISVSHIMISTQKDTSDAPEKRIQELYALLKQGEKFEDIASQFSDDRATGKKGGLLKDFNRGDLRAPGFEEAAYQLDKPGDLSKPVKSQYGWHIIRLEKKYEPETLEEKRVELERRVNDGIRSKKVTSAINNQIKDKYGFKRGNDISFFYDFVSDSILVKKWSYEPLGASDNKLLFKIGDSEMR
jgi:peptidyl-prolyl cis-trans isomerase SurA